MKLSRIGRASLAIVASLSMGLGMTACGGGTIGFLWIMAGKLTDNGNGNVVNGMKIDDYTGNLTEMVHSPFSSGGTNPRMAVLKPGGRFLYVLNQGDSSGDGAGIAEFTVGGDGNLTFQNQFYSQGTLPQWIQIDSTGSYLYALDKVAPTSTGSSIPSGCEVATCGAITVYSIASDTGRLTLVTNNTNKVNNVNLTYYPTGSAPTMLRYLSSGYLLVLNGDETITSYSTATAGQLTLAGNQMEQQVGATSATQFNSITSGGSYVYLTDAATNTIYSYTVSSGIMQAVTGGQTANVTSGVTPVWTMTDSRNKYVYVLNQSNSSATNSYSSISAFTINSDGRLTAVSGINNPYPVGSGPVCMLEDPSNKYVYTSNSLDGTVSGFQINQATGELNTLRRGSTFSVVGKPACLVTSGNVS